MARSVFYYHLKYLQAKDKYAMERETIKAIYHEHKGRYGYRRVTAEMRNRGSGDLAIVADTLPPAIRPLFAEGADLTRAEGVRFRAADNFSGIASWRLHIDGKWVPCDRFPMKGTLVHFFDAPAQRRTHAVRLSVTDGCGNATHFEGTFYR